MLHLYAVSEKSRMPTPYSTPSSLVQETAMSHIQYWFERFAGITDEERRRVAFAKDFFGQRELDTTLLQTPACWRRRTSRSVATRKNGN